MNVEHANSLVPLLFFYNSEKSCHAKDFIFSFHLNLIQTENIMTINLNKMFKVSLKTQKILRIKNDKNK